jgi:hypothetical protein
MLLKVFEIVMNTGALQEQGVPAAFPILLDFGPLSLPLRALCDMEPTLENAETHATSKIGHLLESPLNPGWGEE